MADGIESAFQVRLNDRVKILFLHFHDQAVSCDPRIVYEYVQMPVFFDHVLDHLLAGLKVSDAAPVQRCPAAPALDGVGCFPGAFF